MFSHTNIYSYSKPKNFFKPTFLETILYILATLSIIFIYNLNYILAKLDSSALGAGNSPNSYLSTFFNSLSDSLSSLFQGRLVVAGVWMTIGSSVYLLIIFLLNAIYKLEGDISEIKHRRWTKPLSHRVGRHLSFLAFSILLFAYLVIVLRLLLPSLADLAYLAISNIGTFLAIIELTLTVLITFSVVYLSSLLIKVFIDKWHWL